jgi:hypothetical protein
MSPSDPHLDFIANNNLKLVTDSPSIFTAIGEVALPHPVKSPHGKEVQNLEVHLRETSEGNRLVFELMICMGTTHDEFQIRQRMACVAKLRSSAFETLGDALGDLRQIVSDTHFKRAIDIKGSLLKRFKLPARLTACQAKVRSLHRVKSTDKASYHQSLSSPQKYPRAAEPLPHEGALPVVVLAPNPVPPMPARTINGPMTAAVAIVLPDKLEDWVLQIKEEVGNQCSEFLERSIQIGRQFLAAQDKYHLPLKGLATKADLAYNTVTQYVKMASWFQSTNKSWAPAQLPASVDSIVRLSRLKPDQLEDAFEKGKITRNMGREAVMALLREYRPASLKKRSKAAAGAGSATKLAEKADDQPTEPATDRGPAGNVEFDLEMRRQQLIQAIRREAEGWAPEHAEQFGETAITVTKEIVTEWKSLGVSPSQQKPKK